MTFDQIFRREDVKSGREDVAHINPLSMRGKRKRRIERRPDWRNRGRASQAPLAKPTTPKPKAASRGLRSLDFAPPPLGLWHCQPGRHPQRPTP